MKAALAVLCGALAIGGSSSKKAAASLSVARAADGLQPQPAAPAKLPDSKGNLVSPKHDANGTYTDEAIICGDDAFTPNLPNVKCGGGRQCDRCGDEPGHHWCYNPTQLRVVTPNEKWVFVSGFSAYTECSTRNSRTAMEGCTWNRFDRNPTPTDHFRIDLNNPTEIRATIWSNSWNFYVHLCSEARFYP